MNGKSIDLNHYSKHSKFGIHNQRSPHDLSEHPTLPALVCFYFIGDS